MKHLCCAALLLVVLVAPCVQADEKDQDGFVPMFNGKDLTGWVNVNCAPGTFYVKNGEIITTGKPTGFLRTEKQYENFIADFEWMHENTKEVGNSGFFVWADPLPAVGTGYTRGIEVQVLVNLEYRDKKTNAVTASSHGDIFSIWGATCKPDRPHPKGSARCMPSENLCKGGGEWNHYTVVAKDGIIKLRVNGKEVSGVSACNPRKGYLALESEGAVCHFRNLKIKELPSTNPRPDEIAEQDQGFRNLFNGLDLAGWQADDNAKKHWRTRDGILHFDGQGDVMLSTEKKLGVSEYILDFRQLTKKGEKQAPCAFVFHNDKDKGATLTLHPQGTSGTYTVAVAGNATANDLKSLKPAGEWNRLRVSVNGARLEATINGKDRIDVPIAGAAAVGTFVLKPVGETEFRSVFARE